MRPDPPATDDTIRFVAPARALLPSIRSAAEKLTVLARVNRLVHQNTYNQTIAERAQAMAI